MKTLQNIFSREKDLLYFCMWNDSDRKGVELAGGEIQNNLFVVPPRGKKGSVWYETEELDELKQRVKASLLSHRNNPVWNKIEQLSLDSWAFLKPYVTEQRAIKTSHEFDTYYDHLVDFWTCLNSVLYEVLDDEEIDPVIRQTLAEFRSESEPYSEDMSTILNTYVKSLPHLADVSFVITKEEIARFSQGISPEELDTLKTRLNGCFLLNGTVYPLDQIDTVLAKHNLAFEETETAQHEVTGSVAFPGRIQGIVKIVDGFGDLSKIEPGDILVTQMTNPKYIHAITKAAAIVTDQGGSLCHAAITARELKIPCIVGTKIATKVFHDGDVIEVDANTGIVRLLENTSLVEEHHD